MTCPRCQSDLTPLETSTQPEVVCPECKTPVPNPGSSNGDPQPEQGDPKGQTPSTEKVIVSPGGVQFGSEEEERGPDNGSGQDHLHTAPTATPLDEQTPDLEELPSGLPPDQATSPEEIEEEVRKDFGEYEILAEVGRGAMGIVYRARHRFLKREVAIKVMLAGMYASKKQVARFYREAQAAAKLRHPNIVPIYDIGKRHGRHFFTMDYVEGRSLSSMGHAGDITIRGALRFVIELAEALAYAHSQKVIHRDVKPSNIIVDMDGKPHIMDFGLAKQLDSGTKFTQTGSAIGTPAYMSPEQAAGESHRLDHRSDVYSLGAVLYELVTGRPPFEGDNMMKIIMQVLNHDPALPRALNPKVHRDIQTIILKAMEKNPERRYQTMQEFADDLRRFIAGEAILARPASTLYRTWRKARKHTLAVVSICIACIIAGLSSVVVFVTKEKLQRADQARILAEIELREEKQKEVQAVKPKEVQAVIDDFDGPELAEVWKPQGKPEAWRIEDGKLVAEATGEEVLMLVPPVLLEGNTWLEYQVQIPEDCETYRLDCLIGADHSQAFRVIIESDDPKPHLVLQRSGVKLAEVDIGLFEKGRAYGCLLERRADQLRFELRAGDELVAALRYRDRDIIRDMGTPEDGKFNLGFAVWNSRAHLDGVRVTRESTPTKSPLFYHPQKLMLRKQYDVAITELSDIMLDEMRSEFERHKARHLIGRCWELKGQYGKALEFYEAIPAEIQTPAPAEDEESPDADAFIAENELRKFFCFFRIGRLPQAATALAQLAETGVLIDRANVWHFRDALGRCLVTPRLEEALIILQKARFTPVGPTPEAEAKGLTLHELSRSTGTSLYNDFLEKAVKLALKFAQGTHANYGRIIEVYGAFPDPAMSAAVRQGLRQATRLGKLNDSLALLKFASDELPDAGTLDDEALKLGDRLCQLQHFQRVLDVYQSYPSLRLLACFQKAVDGLLKQGKRDVASTLYSHAVEIAKGREEAVDEVVHESLEKMAASLMDAYARAGAYEPFMKILSAPGRSSVTLVTPVETALARTIEKEEYEQAIELLKAFRERSLPTTETLLRQMQRLADKLAGQQMVQAFKSTYNAYPVDQFATSLVKLMRACQQKEGYASCVELLKFAKDKLDLGLMKEAEPEFEGFLIQFAANANKRGNSQEIIAAHRAFPSEKLLPQFTRAIDLGLTPAVDTQTPSSLNYLSLINLFTYARQHWPFPQAPELHQRLLKFAHGLLTVPKEPAPEGEAEGGEAGEAAPAADDQAVLARRAFEMLVKGFEDAMEESREETEAYYGLAVEYADLLLLADQLPEAGEHLDELAPNLPRQHALRDDVVLRLAVVVADSGDRETAASLWKVLSEESGKDGAYRHLAGFMAGEDVAGAFEGWEDKTLVAFLNALGNHSRGVESDVFQAALEEVVALCKKQPTWYSAVATSRLRKLEKERAEAEATAAAAAAAEAAAKEGEEETPDKPANGEAGPD